MNPNEDLNFEDLVSAYLESKLTTEQEYELLQMLDNPDYARAFGELTRISSEVRGLLASPVSDESMAAVIRRELSYREGSISRRQSRVYQAVMGEISSESRRYPVVFHPPQPAERPFFHWTMAVSAILHAAVIALVIVLHFRAAANNNTTVVEAPKDIAPAEPDSRPTPPLAVENHNNGELAQKNGMPEERIERADLNPVDMQIARVAGEVLSIHEEQRAVAITGAPFGDDDAVETGSKSSVDLRYLDGTRVEVRPDSRLRRMGSQETQNGGKCVYLEHGTLAAAVAHQPAGAPMRLVTPNAEATVLGTKFLLTSYPGQTQLEVTEGVVRLMRLTDGKTVSVEAGHFAIVAEGLDLLVQARGSRRFVKGINFYGPAVTIDTMRWMSHDEALRDGVTLGFNLRGSSSHRVNYTPSPPVDAQMREMLNTRIYSMDDEVSINVPLVDGVYEVELYLFETFRPFSRCFDVEINGVMAQRGVGKQPLNKWTKAGPYRFTVQDGMMRMKAHNTLGNPAINGLCIYSIDPNQN
jgi:hypothetical protein